MLGQSFATLASVLALVAGVSGERCFITNNWKNGSITPGDPNVLIWADGANRDVLLSEAGKDGAFVGAVARNVSQGSVFWVPPRDIVKDHPDALYEFQLWDLNSENGCSSPAFKFAELNDTTESTSSAFYGPFVTTAISIINTGWVTATATVATFSSDGPIFEQQVTGKITATDSDNPAMTVTVGSSSTASASSTLAPDTDRNDNDNDNDNDNSGPNVVAIAVGTVVGVVALAAIVAVVLLWRAKKRKTNRPARADSVTEPKNISPNSTPESQLSEMATAPPPVEVSGATARHEMAGDRSAWHELPPSNMEPVELPAEEIPPPSYPGHEDYAVSPTTGGSRRSSLSFDNGTFTVSPISRRRDEKN